MHGMPHEPSKMTEHQQDEGQDRSLYYKESELTLEMTKKFVNVRAGHGSE